MATHAYRCTQCDTVIHSTIPYTTDPAPFHRHDMVFDEHPLYGFSAGITTCGPLVSIKDPS